jgi:hypothetical protein
LVCDDSASAWNVSSQRGTKQGWFSSLTQD